MDSSNRYRVVASSLLTPRTIEAKNGSAKNRSSDSDTTSATASVCRVTSALAAPLGT